MLVTGKEDRVFADKAYDSRKIFNLLESNDTNAIIPLRKNFRTIARGSPLRHRTAREIRKIGEEEWKRIHDYGRRWNPMDTGSRYSLIPRQLTGSKRAK